MLDNEPAYHTVDKVIAELGANKRKWVVSSVDANTGNYYLMNETLPRDEHARAFVASTLIPAVFPHDNWGNAVLMDGGTVWNTNLVSAVQRCREQVDDDSQITLDIIVCGYPKIDTTWEFKDETIENFLRYKDIKDFYSHSEDIAGFIKAFPKVNFRYFLAPSQPLAGGLAILDFNNATSTWPMQMIGRTDGENAIKAGPGFMFNKIN